MAFVGRLHPLLIHFPIALVLAAAAAESVAILTNNRKWRAMAIGNVRAGAVFALLAAAAGWGLASAAGVENTPLLGWHRWLGTIAAGVTAAAALASYGGDSRSASASWAYRFALFGAGALMAVVGHLGGVLVWGADFLRP
jgi:uncharacterized membrane protein